jgi:predicted amidohydrolase
LKIKAGFVQTSPIFGEVEKNLFKAIEMIENLDADLIVLPELFNTGYFFTDTHELEKFAESAFHGKTVKTLIKVAEKKKTFIVAGLAEECEGHFYNSSVFITPDGDVQVYRKAHLFYKEKLVFSKGNTHFPVYNTCKGKIGVMICFDWIFPEVCRSLALKGAEIICQPANLVLPHCPLAMRVRSIENRVFTVTANRIGSEEKEGEKLNFIGMSQIVNTKGEILIQAGSDKEEAMSVEIDLSEAQNKKITPYNDVFADRREELYVM